MHVKSKINNVIENPKRAWRNTKFWITKKVRKYLSRVNDHPVLVFGNQKSGTSVITALLGKATGLSYTIDIFCLYGNTVEQLLTGAKDFDVFLKEARYHFSKDIVKEPSFIAFYEELTSRFPDAQFVFVVRHPVANIRSILDRLNLPGNKNSLDKCHWRQVENDSRNWKIILEGTHYDHKGDNYIDTLARRWKKSAQLYLSNSDRFEKITYEAFCQDKEERIYGLAQRLGLDTPNDISDKVDVQYQPKGQRNVDPQSFFGERNLKVIHEVCQPEMKSIGYESLIPTRTCS